MHDISQVLKEDMCAGCGLCVNKKENMVIDENGYLRPDSFINDEIAIQSCPSICVTQYNKFAPYDNLWGPVLSCNSGYSRDDNIRYSGSSGGVLTALTSFLLTKNKVDGVIQVGVASDDPLRNETYIHRKVENIIKCAGSRYAPSSPLNVVRSLLGNGKKYAIVGKPCDISALRSLVNLFPIYKDQFPYLLSFMCAGVPSENGSEEVLKKFGIKREQLKSFRYRGEGWPGKTKAVLNDNSEYVMTYNESWGTILNRYLQTRCKVCADGIGESADIVCGDAWHASSDGYPSFDEDSGRSLVIVRTKVGQNLLDEAVNFGEISLTDFPISELNKIQPYQAKRKQTALIRKFAIVLLLGKSPTFKGFKLWHLLFHTNLKITIKVFLGTLIRKIKGRV